MFSSVSIIPSDVNIVEQAGLLGPRLYKLQVLKEKGLKMDFLRLRQLLKLNLPSSVVRKEFDRLLDLFLRKEYIETYRQVDFEIWKFNMEQDYKVGRLSKTEYDEFIQEWKRYGRLYNLIERDFDESKYDSRMNRK